MSSTGEQEQGRSPEQDSCGESRLQRGRLTSLSRLSESDRDHGLERGLKLAQSSPAACGTGTALRCCCCEAAIALTGMSRDKSRDQGSQRIRCLGGDGSHIGNTPCLVGSQLLEGISGKIWSTSSQQMPEQASEGVHLGRGTALVTSANQFGGDSLIACDGKDSVNRDLRMRCGHHPRVDDLDTSL